MMEEVCIPDESFCHYSRCRAGHANGPRCAGEGRHQSQAVHAADGSPILIHTIRKFVSCPSVTEIVVALRGDDMLGRNRFLQQRASLRAYAASRAANRGNNRSKTRWPSITPDTDLVAVHDAVRPFVSLETIEKVILEAGETGAAIVGLFR